jgi:phage terminase small subunit
VTPRNERFIELYVRLCVLEGQPAAEAYRQSGYKSNSPEVEACKLLKNPNIAAEIEKRKKEIFEKEKVTSEKVLRELANIAFSNVQDYLLYDEHGRVRFKKSRNLTRSQAAAVAGIKVNKKEKTIELKFHDKVQSLELLGKNLGVFPNKVQMGGDPDNPVPVKQEIVFKGIPRPPKDQLKRPDERSK